MLFTVNEYCMVISNIPRLEVDEFVCGCRGPTQLP